jgi:hypothetical protein
MFWYFGFIEFLQVKAVVTTCCIVEGCRAYVMFAPCSPRAPKHQLLLGRCLLQTTPAPAAVVTAAAAAAAPVAAANRLPNTWL